MREEILSPKTSTTHCAAHTTYQDEQSHQGSWPRHRTGAKRCGCSYRCTATRASLAAPVPDAPRSPEKRHLRLAAATHAPSGRSRSLACFGLGRSLSFGSTPSRSLAPATFVPKRNHTRSKRRGSGDQLRCLLPSPCQPPSPSALRNVPLTNVEMRGISLRLRQQR